MITSSRTPQRLLAAPVALMLSLGLLAACSKSSNDSPVITPVSANPSVATSPTPRPTANVTVLTIKVAGGKAVGGVQALSAKLGASVELLVTSPDTTSEVHLHGYDLMDEVTPTKAAKMDFVAKISGVFEIELEDTSVKIANLTVR